MKYRSPRDRSVTAQQAGPTSITTYLLLNLWTGLLLYAAIRGFFLD